MCYLWNPFWRFYPGGGFIMMLFGLILLAVILYFLFKTFKPSFKGEFEDSGLKILNEKLAKGEITEEEYKRKKELIMKGRF